MLFCLVSLLWVFVVSHDWKPSNEKNNPDVRRIRADTGEPVFWLVLSIGLAMVCFTLYTLRKVTSMRVATCPPCALSAPSSHRVGKTHPPKGLGCTDARRLRRRLFPAAPCWCVGVAFILIHSPPLQRHLSGGAGRESGLMRGLRRL